MYADRVTDSMQKTIDETNRRREKQLKYNEQFQITRKRFSKRGADTQSVGCAAIKKANPTAYIEREEG